MNIVWDPVYVVNLALCVVILALGMGGWRRSGKSSILYVGIAFGLFGASHLATLIGLKYSLENTLVVVRTLAYLLVAFALYQIAYRAK